MKERTLKEMGFRPVFHVTIRSKSGGIVPEASRELAREGIKYGGTNYDFTLPANQQPKNPQTYLFRGMDEACVAKMTLEAISGVASAPLTKFDGPDAERTRFSGDEIERAGAYRLIPKDESAMEI